MKQPSVKKKVTVFDVARLAGISKSTVSLVLTHSDKVSSKTKTKVLKAIEQLGYVYNRDAAALRSKNSKLVALVINDLSDPLVAQLAVELEQAIAELGLVAMLVSSGENLVRQAHIVNRLKEYNVAAFIICPALGTSASWIDNIIRQGFPVITILREVPFASAPSVQPDNRAGGRLATEHLLAQGLSKIAFIGGVAGISDYHQRLSGYLDAMSAANRQAPDYYQIPAPNSRQGGRDATQHLLSQVPDIEAIICFSDVIATGAIEQLRQQLGSVIKIIGFDDLADSPLMSPPLSSIDLATTAIADKTAQLLNQILAGQPPIGPTLIDVALKVRASSLA